MSPQVRINGELVSFTEEPPAELDFLRLYNSRGFFSSGTYGNLFIQYINEYGLGTFYLTASLREKVTLWVHLPHPSLFCMINLAGSLEGAGSDGNTFGCGRNSALLAFSDLRNYMWKGKEGSYRLVVFLYPVSLAKKLLYRFPALQPLKEQLQREEEWMLPNVVSPVFAAISGCIYEVLHVPRTFFTEQHHQQNIVQLLKLVCGHMSQNTPPQPASTLSDVESVKKAKEWLDVHLDKHTTLADLARKVGINEFKLKKIFKELYGVGVYGYFIAQRMEVAKNYLDETNLPIREIARRVGYGKRNNFSAAFKRVYGVTPLQHRHRQNP